MPQFKVKIKDRDSNKTESVSVWADTQREANVKAIKLAKALLGTDNLEVA